MNESSNSRVTPILALSAVVIMVAVTAFVIISAEESDAVEFSQNGLRYSLEGNELTFIGPQYNMSVVEVPETVEYYGRTYTVSYISLEQTSYTIRELHLPSTISVSRYPICYDDIETVSIEVDEGNPTLTSVDGILYSADMTSLIWYPMNKAGTSFSVPDSVTKIMNGAFQYCGNLRSVDLNNVSIIGDRAFWNCINISEIDLPDSVSSILRTPFTGCSSLTSINVGSGNSHFTSVDGVLYSADMRTIVKYPDGKTATSYSIPSSVRTIGIGAFWLEDSLRSVTIPEGVTSIEQDAFLGTSLTSVTLPSSVTEIGRVAFRSCELTEVTILGNNVSIGEFAFDGNYGLRNIWIQGSLGTLDEEAFSIGDSGRSVSCTVHTDRSLDLSRYSNQYTTFLYVPIGSDIPDEPVTPDNPDQPTTPDDPDVPVTPENPGTDTPGGNEPSTPSSGGDSPGLSENGAIIIVNLVMLVVFILVMFINLILYLKIKI